VNAYRLAGLGFVVALVAGLVGYQVQKLAQPASPMPVLGGTATPSRDTKLLGQVRPEFALQDLDGRRHSVTEWDGKVLALNFWASWCLPCREEIPGFIMLQEKFADQGLQFIGIALERTETARSFVAEVGINYPVLIGEQEVIRIAEQYGNTIGALPYTVIIDRNGKIAFIKRGPLHADKAEDIINSLF